MTVPILVHERIRTWVREAIQRGEYHPGDRLPSQRDLCAQFSTSLMTVRRAIDALLAEGIIIAVPGKGLYAAEHKQPAQLAALLSFSEDMARRGLSVTSRILEARTLPASPGLAGRMEIDADTELVYLRRLRLAGTRALAIQTNWLVHALCPGLLFQELTQRGLFAVLRAEYNLTASAETTLVEAVLAGEEEGSLLGLELPAALLVSEHLTRRSDGRVFDLARTVFPGDRYQYQRVD